MKKVAAFILLSELLTLAVRAQLNPLPPSSSTDGVVVKNSGVDTTGWQSSSLMDYSLSTTFQTPANNSADIYGRTWGSQAPSRTTLDSQGGCMRLIFLGGSTTGNSSVGYTYSGTPATNSYTIGNASTFSFGDHVDLAMGKGVGDNFDLWTTSGNNAFCLFNISNSLLSNISGTVSWLQDPLLVTTYIPAYGIYENVETWVASIDEYTGNDSSSISSYRIAVQFYYPTGMPFVSPSAVPEPATYGLFAGMALAFLIFRHRFNQNKN